MEPPYTSTMSNDHYYWLPQDSSNLRLPLNYPPSLPSSNLHLYVNNNTVLSYPSAGYISPSFIATTPYPPSSFTPTTSPLSMTSETHSMQINTTPFTLAKNTSTYTLSNAPPDFPPLMPSIHAVPSYNAPPLTIPSISSTISPPSSCLPLDILSSSLPIKKKRKYIRRQVIPSSPTSSCVPLPLSDPSSNPSLLFIASHSILVLNVPCPYFHFPLSPLPPLSHLPLLSPFTLCESNQDFKWNPQHPKFKKLTFHRWLPCATSPFSFKPSLSLSAPLSTSTSSSSSDDFTHDEDVLWFFKDPIKRNRPINEFLIPSQLTKTSFTPTFVTLKLGSSARASSFTFVKIKRDELESFKNCLNLSSDQNSKQEEIHKREIKELHEHFPPVKKLMHESRSFLLHR